MVWELVNGYFLFAAHLNRLQGIAAYFNIRLDRFTVETNLTKLESTLDNASKIRLVVNLDCTFNLEVEPLTNTNANWSKSQPLRVSLSQTPIDSSNIWLYCWYHKTTHRELYDIARASRPDCDDVILWNERGELTEASMANLVLELHGEWVTPSTTSGILSGTFRDYLISTGQIKERILTPPDLYSARQIALINSVCKWQPAILIS